MIRKGAEAYFLPESREEGDAAKCQRKKKRKVRGRKRNRGEEIERYSGFFDAQSLLLCPFSLILDGISDKVEIAKS